MTTDKEVRRAEAARRTDRRRPASRSGTQRGLKHSKVHHKRTRKRLPGMGKSPRKQARPSGKGANHRRKGSAGRPRSPAKSKKTRGTRGPRLVLSTIVGSRQTIERLLRGYFTGKVSERQLRSAVHAIRAASGLLRFERTEELLRRLGEVERRLGLQREDGTVVRFRGGGTG